MAYNEKAKLSHIARKAMKRYKRKGLCKQIRGNRGLDVFKWMGIKTKNFN